MGDLVELPIDLSKVADKEHRKLLEVLINSNLNISDLSRRINISRQKLYRIAKLYLGADFIARRDEAIRMNHLERAESRGMTVDDNVITIEAPEVLSGAVDSEPDGDRESTPAVAALAPQTEEAAAHHADTRPIPDFSQDLTKQNFFTSQVEKACRRIFIRGESITHSQIKYYTGARSQLSVLQALLELYCRSVTGQLSECSSPACPGLTFNAFLQAQLLRYALIKTVQPYLVPCCAGGTHKCQESLPYLPEATVNPDRCRDVHIKYGDAEVDFTCDVAGQADAVSKIIKTLKEAM